MLHIHDIYVCLKICQHTHPLVQSYIQKTYILTNIQACITGIRRNIQPVSQIINKTTTVETLQIYNPSNENGNKHTDTSTIYLHKV